MTYKVGMDLNEAKTLAKELTEKLAALGAKKTEVVGSVLREETTIGDIDIIVDGDIGKLGTELGEIKKGGSSIVTLVYQGQQINLFRGSESNWGAMRFYLIGPTNYTIAYRVRAKKKGWTLNQMGLFDADGKLLEGADEAKIYELLGKTWKEPKLRGKR